MKLKNLAHLPSCRKMGVLEYMNKVTSGAACLAAFCRLHGHAARITDLLPFTQFPGKNGSTLSMRQWQRLAARFGIALRTLPNDEITVASRREVLLIQNRDGYCFLLMPHSGGTYCACLPGYQGNYVQIAKNSDLLAHVQNAFILRKLPFLEVPLIQARRPAYFWLLPQIDNLPVFDAAKLQQEKLRRFQAKGKEESHTQLSGWEIKHLLQAHRQLVHDTGLEDWYGCWRRAEFFRSDRMFAPLAEIEWRCSHLLKSAQDQMMQWSEIKVSAEQVADFAACLYADFNAIHPFYNANHRVAAAMINHWLAALGYLMDWQRLQKGQYYFWVRCAHRGHLGLLREGFLRCIQKIDDKVSTSLPTN